MLHGGDSEYTVLHVHIAVHWYYNALLYSNDGAQFLGLKNLMNSIKDIANNNNYCIFFLHIQLWYT